LSPKINRACFENKIVNNIKDTEKSKIPIKILTVFSQIINLFKLNLENLGIINVENNTPNIFIKTPNLPNAAKLAIDEVRPKRETSHIVS
jgi:hypothetical protein